MTQRADEFEAHRPRMFGIAYRMLSSVADAEDIVQDTYLRFAATPQESIRSVPALLTTIVTRLCLNFLQSARVRRETYVGPWLPEPLLVGSTYSQNGSEPLSHLADVETISMAFLVLLERLTPLARAVFILREVFDYDYSEIGAIVEREPTTCRQIFSRARKELAQGERRFRPSDEDHQRILLSFMQAVTRGDMKSLTDMLAEDVVMWADGGGKVRGAATRPLYGREPVATFLVSSTRFISSELSSFEVVTLNAQPAVIIRDAGRPVVVVSTDVDEFQIRTLRLIANPDNLRRL